MITIKKAPPYIAKVLCDNAGIEYSEKYEYFAAKEDWNIYGFCAFFVEDKNVTMTYAEAKNAEILDGVVRAGIAGGEMMGAVTYDFEVSQEVAKNILPLGFRKCVTDGHHSIEKLFSVCTGCAKAEE